MAARPPGRDKWFARVTGPLRALTATDLSHPPTTGIEYWRSSFFTGQGKSVVRIMVSTYDQAHFRMYPSLPLDVVRSPLFMGAGSR